MRKAEESERLGASATILMAVLLRKTAKPDQPRLGRFDLERELRQPHGELREEAPCVVLMGEANDCLEKSAKDPQQSRILNSMLKKTQHVIADQWDRLGQFYASLESGHTTASVALRRLQQQILPGEP